MRLIERSLTKNVYNALNESSDFETYIDYSQEPPVERQRHTQEYCNTAALQYVLDNLPSELGANWQKKSLVDIEDVVHDLVYRYNEANAEPEYEDYDFYEDEANPIEIYNFILDKYNLRKDLRTKDMNESTELNINDIDIDEPNSMETIRKYVSAQEQHKGTSIRFDSFNDGHYVYDLRIYVGGLTTKDEVRAALIPYKLDEEGRVIRVDKDIIKLDDFRLDMTDEEVISLVSSKLGLKGITRYEE